MTNARRDFSDEQYIEAVREHGPAGTSEIADYVGCTVDNARIRLRNLHEKDTIARKSVGNSYIWFIE